MSQALMPIQESGVIQGIFTVPIRAHADERGRFREIFRKEWFPWIDFTCLQSNLSESKTNVLRGLHYHLHQIDYWFVTKGMIRVGLADLRPNSPTYRATQTIDIGEDNGIGLFIPIGVAHGFVALTDAALIYYVNQYYNGGRDENGIAWNDPDLNVAWGISDPILSGRDMENPLLRDIPKEKLP
jgi:dTDP-4-dehydrorhamnose 3,5-epimerase